MSQHLVNAGVIQPLDCTILSGLPGSGKSTHVAALLAANPTAALIHPDSLRAEVTGDESNFSRDSFIWNTLIPIRMNGAMAERRAIIFDACMVNRKARKPIIAHARWLGYRIVVHVVKTPVDECVRRNAARARQVPIEVIAKMQAKWADPTLDEGIDEIVEVGDLPLDTSGQTVDG